MMSEEELTITMSEGELTRALLRLEKTMNLLCH